MTLEILYPKPGFGQKTSGKKKIIEQAYHWFVKTLMSSWKQLFITF